MDISRDDTITLVADTWQTLLGEPARPESDEVTEKWDLLSRVEIRGAWNGSISVGLTDSGARWITTQLLDAGPSDVTEDEILDSAREVANILGGNFKVFAPQPSSLGLPKVTHAPFEHSPDSEGILVYRLNFAWLDFRFTVIIEASKGADR